MCALLSDTLFQNRDQWSSLPVLPKVHPLPCDHPAAGPIPRSALTWYYRPGNNRDPPRLAACIPVSRIEDFCNAEAAAGATTLYAHGKSIPDHSNRKRAPRWDTCLSRVTYHCNHGPEDHSRGLSKPPAPSCAQSGGSEQLVPQLDTAVTAASPVSTGAIAQAAAAAALPGSEGGYGMVSMHQP